MSDAYTGHLNLILMPTGSHLNDWGLKLNANFSDIDAKVLPLTGGTVTGTVNVVPPSAGVYLQGVQGTSGGVNYSPIFALDSNWGEISYLQAYHQPGTKAGMTLVVGSTAAKVWQFGNDGVLTAPNHIAIPQGSQYQMGAGASLSLEASGNLILTRAPGYYYGRLSSGVWQWVENNVGTMSVDGGGNLWAKGNITAAADVYAGGSIALSNDKLIGWNGNASYLVRQSAGHFIINARSDYRQYWDSTSGSWAWQHGGSFEVTDMILNNAGGLNVRGSIGAGGSVSCTDLYCANVRQNGRAFQWAWSPYVGQPAVDWYVDGAYRGKMIFSSSIATFSMAGAGFNVLDGDGAYWSVTMNVSDERRKHNIAPVEGDSLAVVNALALRSFDYNDIEDHVAAGVTAQQTQGVDPTLVYEFGDPDAPQLNVNLYKLTGRLIGAVQQLTARIEAMEGGD